MLSKEEKDAIKLLKDIENDCWTTKYIMSSDSKNAKILLSLITKQSNILNKIEEYAKGMKDKELLLILKSNEIDELINIGKKE